MPNVIKNINNLASVSVLKKNGLSRISVKSFNGALASGAVYGYFCGGSVSATLDRITFSTSVCYTNTSNLSLARGSGGAVSDKTTYGYVCGGYSGGGSPGIKKITDRITFSTSAVAANTASDLSGIRYQGMGCISDGITYGYIGGGLSGTSSSTYLAITDRITFATSVTALNTASNITGKRRGPSGVSDGATYGYFCGGNTESTYYTTTDRIVFSTSVTSVNTASNLSQARFSGSGISDGVTYGYVGGGISATGIMVTTADRITFSTGVTAANTASDLTVAAQQNGSNSDGVIYGYWAGGLNDTSNIDRITFSTSSTAANTASDLVTARYNCPGLSDYAI